MKKSSIIEHKISQADIADLADFLLIYKYNTLLPKPSKKEKLIHNLVLLRNEGTHARFDKDCLPYFAEFLV